MTDISEAGASFFRDLRDAARENPISAALIGMGVLWMLGGAEAVRRAGAAMADAGPSSEPGRQTSGSVRSSVESGAERARSTMTSAAQNMGDRVASAVSSATQFGRQQVGSTASGVASAAQNIGESAASAADNVSRFGRKQAQTASDYARSMPDVGQSMPEGAGLYETVRSKFSELSRTQPLALGAIALAVGAGIAAALPVSEMESTYFGEASDAFRKNASDLVSEQASRAKDVAKDAVDAAIEEGSKAALNR